MSPAIEQWRPVTGTAGFYEVSNLGRVRSLPRHGTRGGVIVPTVHRKTGHRQVRLCVTGRQWRVSLHVLVLEVFVGSRPPGMVCRHIDGDTSNNRADNLAWGTPSENMADKIRDTLLYACQQFSVSMAALWEQIQLALLPLVRAVNDQIEQLRPLCAEHARRQPPADPMERALWLRRNRNTGPRPRQRAPRRIDPRGTR